MMKNVYKVDVILVVVSLVVLLGLVGYARPLVIAPVDDYESSGEVLFLIEKADYLLVDDNVDFTTPDRYGVRDGLEIDLTPGKYYWKAVGVLDGEIRTLMINSVVSLELREVDGGYGVVNGGNVRLNVDVYDGMELIEKVKLDVGEFVEGGDKFVGGQDE
jgi:hypothetical protein